MDESALRETRCVAIFKVPVSVAFDFESCKPHFLNCQNEGGGCDGVQFFNLVSEV